MVMIGHLKKMQVGVNAGVAQYGMRLDEQLFELNPYIGKTIHMEFQGEIHCLHCGRQTKKSFNQGYCFPCSQKLAACDLCILKPERCHFHLGTCREPDWALAHCMVEHIVYLANSSGIKVGLTRHSQIPTRWLDQGAGQALPIYRCKNRLLAGLLEVAIAQYIADKTDWRKLLKGDSEPRDLIRQRNDLWNKLPPFEAELAKSHGEQSFTRIDEVVQSFKFPVQKYPEKISSWSFDKTPHVHGQLLGIKGQNLILDSGVINIRKLTSYKISFT